MKKLAVSSLVMLLFLSGCSTQPTVPSDTFSAPSQVINSVAESQNKPHFSKETVIEIASKAPTVKPEVIPESNSIKTESTSVPQIKTETDTPSKPKDETEIEPPTINMGKSPISPMPEETSSQIQPKPPKPQPEPERSIHSPLQTLRTAVQRSLPPKSRNWSSSWQTTCRARINSFSCTFATSGLSSQATTGFQLGARFSLDAFGMDR